jgi:putative ABC transport system permease protein
VVRRLVHDLDPSIPLGSVVTMSDRIAGSIAEPRFYTTLFATFAATAIALAAVGIFSTMTYSVTRRSKELGIRMALGAAPGRVFTVVLRQAAVVTMLGAVLGIAGAIGVTRILTGFLFGVTATDPVTFVTAAGLLGGVAMLACIAPARRATTVDPVQSLRVE